MCVFVVCVCAYVCVCVCVCVCVEVTTSRSYHATVVEWYLSAISGTLLYRALGTEVETKAVVKKGVAVTQETATV